MGEVYRARDTRLERTVAIKILPSQFCSDPVHKQRFEREAKTISQLNHPHICVLHDVGHQDGMDYLVMELLEGETLAQHLQKGPLALAQVLKYGTQIADALDKAHRQGVVHRDLKPLNVMLTPTGAKLLDFGLAKARTSLAPGFSLTLAPTQDSPVTEHGTIVGTFQYMSPEQIEGKELDGRSDLFAFGAMLYEMVTARRAFQGKSSLSVASAILEKEPEPISALAPMTPPALDRTIHKCLAKDPEDRWQTARDLLLELKWIEEAGSQAALPAVVSTRRRIAEQIWMSAAAVLLLTTAALGALYWRSVSRQPQVIRALVAPPEKTQFRFVGAQTAGPVAVSPDGRMLAFSAQREDGPQSLYVRAIDSLTAQAMAGTEGAAMPFWSPDSRKIAFFAEGKLKKIDVAGGPPVTLCDARSGTVPRGGSWSRQGVIVFASGPNSPLLQVSEQGGQPTPATQLDASRGESSHRWPQFLPDGKRFLFYARAGLLGTNAEENALMVGSFEAAPPKLLLRTQSNAVYASGYLLFLHENTLMAQAFDPDGLRLSGEAVPIAQQVQADPGASRGVFSVSENGVLAYQTGEAQVLSQLLWFDRSGKQTAVLGDPAVFADLRVSPDRQKVATTVVDPRFGPPDVWVYDASRGVRSRFTFHPGPERFPVWSPDSTRVVFGSSRKGRFDLYVKSYTGSGNEELLLETDHDKFPTDWSPDGRYILYQDLGPGTRSDVWALPLFGDRKPMPLLQTPFEEGGAALSHDGRWMAYVSDESGSNDVYVTTFPVPGRKWQVSTGGGGLPRWSRNGNEVVYLGPGTRLFAAEVSVTGETLQVGKTQALFVTRVWRPGVIYDVTRDGQRFLVNTAALGQNPGPLTLVVNWPAELKKRPQ
jgi:eukaryotic-like serine/threonine-protein kinase